MILQDSVTGLHYEIKILDGQLVISETTSTDPTSDVDITLVVNKALTLIGADPIVSIVDGTNTANIMLSVYVTALKSILSECLWGFATKRALLTTASTTSLAWLHSDESYAYTKPTDIVRIFETNDNHAVWREEGEFVLSNASDLGIKYTYYNDDPTKWKASFTEAFVDILAYQACFMISNSGPRASELFQKYEKVSLPKAKSENSQTGTQQSVIDDAWEMAKYSNFNPEA
jgi:hypothetical protein